MKKLLILLFLGSIFLAAASLSAAAEDASVVYFTSDITADGLVKIYEALNWTPSGKVAVKISTGEPPASNYLRPELIGDLVQLLDGTIVECNTAYGGSRSSSAMHKQVAAGSLLSLRLTCWMRKVRWNGLLPAVSGLIGRLSALMRKTIRTGSSFLISRGTRWPDTEGLSRMLLLECPRQAVRFMSIPRERKPAAASGTATRMPGWKPWRRWYSASAAMWAKSTLSTSM